jgi:hypothetical protein
MSESGTQNVQWGMTLLKQVNTDTSQGFQCLLLVVVTSVYIGWLLCALAVAVLLLTGSGYRSSFLLLIQDSFFQVLKLSSYSNLPKITNITGTREINSVSCRQRFLSY